MDRTQFTFYESFFTAISRIKKKADRADAYDAVCAYALYGQTPDMDKIPDAAAIAFTLIKPNLDASRRKAAGGKKRRGDKQEGSEAGATGEDAGKIPERYGEDTGNKKEDEIENEREDELESECYPPTPLVGGVVSKVLADYLDRVNPAASPYSLDELKGYAEELGEAVCKRAFDIALDEKKPSWSYIRGILRRLQSQGVRSLADWDGIEQRRKEMQLPKAPGRSGMPTVEPPAPEEVRENLARMARYREQLKEEADSAGE